MREFIKLSYIFLFIVISACSEDEFVDSSPVIDDEPDPVVAPTNVLTQDIDFDAIVTISETSLHVKVYIKESGSDIKLTGGDLLAVNAGGVDVILKREKSYYFCIALFNLCSTTFYEKTIPVSDVTNSVVQIKLLRPEGEPAINNFVTLPERATLVSPQTGESYSRSVDDITVMWNESLLAFESVQIEAKGYYSIEHVDDYFYYYGFESTDGGEHTIPAGSISSKGYIDPADTITLNKEVDIRVSVARNITGTTDDAFMSGTIRAKSIGSVIVTSTF